MSEQTKAGPGSTIRFGEFELDSRRGVLLRRGVALKLQPQPLRVLELLVERAPEIVTREELANHVWGAGVHVDAEQSLNYCIRQIRLVLEDQPVNPKFVETLPRQGYRFVGVVEREEVSSENDAEGNEAEATPEIVPERVRGRRWTDRWRWVWVVAGVLVLAVGWLGWRRWRGPEPIRSLAVLPLENLSGDAGQEYFVDGMTDELITELARIPTLRVVSRTSVMQDKGARRPLPEIARELNVDAIVEGSVVRSGDKVRITAQLIDARTDKHLWAESFERTANDVLSLQDGVAREIAAQTRGVLAPEVRMGIDDARRVDPAAHDAYLRGRYFLNKRDAGRGVEYFRQAIAIDATYSQAYSGLANALTSEAMLGAIPRAEATAKVQEAARRAIELDPKNGEAYMTLGIVENMLTWDWAAAEEDIKRGVALSPGDSYAELQYATWLDTMNRPEEAIRPMRRALELDPLSFFMNRQMGSVLYFARNYDEALYYLRRAREMEPGRSGAVDNWMSWVYQKKGMQDEAVRSDLALVRAEWPKLDADGLNAIYRGGGWAAYWKARTDALKTAYPERPCMSYELGIGYLRAGDRDEAFSRLNQAVNERCFWMIWLRVDPLMDEIRNDRRYDELLRRMNLPG